jgi:histidinol-phosphate aminotransferase
MSFLDYVPQNIRDIQPYKPGKPVEEVERETGVKAVKLASNENPLGPSPKALDVMRHYIEHVERYPDDTGFYLRQRLAAHFKVSVDQIVLGAGSSDILSMAYQAVLGEDSEVLTSDGSFVVYYLLGEVKGCQVVRTPMREFGYDLEAMAERLTAKTRIVLIANPNNPTGTIVRRKELDRLMSRIPEHALVILDEAYFEFVSDPEYPNAFEYLNAGRNVLVVRTFSKAYGLAGLRIGYGISHAPIIETLQKARMAFNTGSVAQAAALAAWDDTDHVRRTVELNRTEMDFLYRELAARKVRYVPSHSNFIFMDLGKPSMEVNSAMLAQGVIIRPMSPWGFQTMIRLSIGTHEQNQKFLKALDTIR